MHTKKKKKRLPFTYTFEPLGWIPRSIRRTCDRFFFQLGKTSPIFALQEFRLSRYQALAALKCLTSFLLIPLIFRRGVTQLIIIPIIKAGWSRLLPNFFLTNFQQIECIQTVQQFEEVYFFDSLLELNIPENTRPIHLAFFDQYQDTFNTIVLVAQHRSLGAFVDICADICTVLLLVFLWFQWTPQRIILRSFLVESLYSLRDEWRAFLLILITDLLVGFHSSRGWQLLLASGLSYLGQNPNNDIVGLFVSTFPVLLDTVFKYWIFRYLNKISPSTVATYQSMLE